MAPDLLSCLFTELREANAGLGGYARIARRRGKAKAQVAVARSILVIIWHLLADPEARYTDLSYGYYQARTDTDRKLRNHIRQIQALGFAITPTRGRLTSYRP